MASQDKYYLFLDECGDQNLSSFDPNFPIFTLCGIIVSEQNLGILEAQINDLKMRLWKNINIIFHSRDIRKCQNGFENFFDLSVKQDFYKSINKILGQDIYVVICCAILKEPYIRQYGKMNDVYGQSLSFIMERTVFYLDSMKNCNANLTTVIERRGKKEDNALLDYYNRVLDKGTYWVTSDRMKKYFKKFEMKWKKDNIVGLQIADLIAYPVTRYILNPEGVNYAFDIINKNIYQDRGKLYGLKVFPKES